jgi:hypothetical protein
LIKGVKKVASHCLSKLHSGKESDARKLHSGKDGRKAAAAEEERKEEEDDDDDGDDGEEEEKQQTNQAVRGNRRGDMKDDSNKIAPPALKPIRTSLYFRRSRVRVKLSTIIEDPNEGLDDDIDADDIGSTPNVKRRHEVDSFTTLFVFLHVPIR